jgi:hypothetical protein
MAYQLDVLKFETHRAEKDFQNAVRNYMLFPLDTTEEFKQALRGLFESITNYRIVLDRLRKYLAVMRESESLTTRQKTIERAIVSLNTKDAALERLLKNVSRLAASHS